MQQAAISPRRHGNAAHRLGQLAVILLGALLAAPAALADGPGQGELTRRNLQVGDCHVDRMTVKYDLDSFFGEPTVAGTYRWRGESGCELHYATTVWLKLETSQGHGYVRLAPAIPDQGEWAYNTKGSPDWDDVVCGSGTNDEDCMPPDDAKYMWRHGRVTEFQVGLGSH